MTSMNLYAIKIGARYRHPAGSPLVYRFVRVVEIDQHSPHAILMADAIHRRLITVGISVLQDRAQWVLVN